MKLLLFFTILCYKCNNLAFGYYETIPSTSSGSSSSSSLESPSLTSSIIKQQSSSLEELDPISTIDIDYLKNGLVFQFRRSIKSDNTEIETRRRSALDKNFMRFGRGGKNMMRFGRSGDNKNLMRFGRADTKNLMRFGRNTQNRMRFGKRDKNLMRFGRGSDNRMRFGKRTAGNLMRFGRNDKDFLLAANDDHFENNNNNNNNLDNLEKILASRNDETHQGKNFMIYGSLEKNALRFANENEDESQQNENLSSASSSQSNETELENSRYSPPLKILFDENGNKPPIIVKPIKLNKETENFMENDNFLSSNDENSLGNSEFYIE